MALEAYLKDRLKTKEILLMTHIVLGYPSLDDSFRIIEFQKLSVIICRHSHKDPCLRVY